MTTRHIIFKLQKFKDLKKTLLHGRGDAHLTCRGARIRMAANCPPETLPARREGNKAQHPE